MSITANKGEWSELYVLFKLLGEKKVHSGDGNLNKLEAHYPILNIIRDELTRHLEYSINYDSDIVIITEDGQGIAQITVGDFLEQSAILFTHIQQGPKGKGAFNIPEIEPFLQAIHCQKIKAKSSDKADIHIIIHDYHTGMEPNLGFSIKSDAGSAPTLLNASTPTTFTFEVIGDNINDTLAQRINAISGSRKMQDRVSAILNSGSQLKFSKIANSTFNSNLRMIDSFLPEIIGWMLVDCYAQRTMSISDAVERINIANPINYDLSDGHNYYGYKIKSLMVCTALGMLPATTWDGQYDATGGYLVVKKDGDIICFHLYDRNLLEDYLFYNTKFETPTGDRYNIGEIYKEDGKYYFNLVLQIRFK